MIENCTALGFFCYKVAQVIDIYWSHYPNWRDKTIKAVTCVNAEAMLTMAYVAGVDDATSAAHWCRQICADLPRCIKLLRHSAVCHWREIWNEVSVGFNLAQSLGPGLLYWLAVYPLREKPPVCVNLCLKYRIIILIIFIIRLGQILPSHISNTPHTL